jgi:serine/threonine-protein kinase
MIFSPIFANWILREVVVARGPESLSGWKPYYVNLLPPIQKETFEDLVDAVISWPVIVKNPELLAQLLAQDEISLPSNPAGEQVLGRYIIEELIGGGGMADIFRARDLRLDRPVAIKRLRPALSEAEEFQARFEREAKAVALLRHPHIVQVHDFGVQDNHYYMVMDFIEGHNLREHLHNLQAAGQTLPWEESLRIAACIADALDYAHHRQMIHRDVKPSNILLTNEGGVFLTDFGLVRLLGQSDLTPSGGFVGTLAYMAPEQMMGQSQSTDHRADIYALGCIVYEMITGRLPFDQADFPLAHLDIDPPAPSLIVPALPEAASQVILKALAKDPAKRPASASQFIEDLRRALGG